MLVFCSYKKGRPTLLFILNDDEYECRPRPHCLHSEPALYMKLDRKLTHYTCVIRLVRLCNVINQTWKMKNWTFTGDKIMIIIFYTAMEKIGSINLF